MRRPVCLDTFCCGQGAGVGYQRAGYDVYGIEIDPKRLRDAPLPYLVGDAMEALIRLKEGEGLTFSDGRTLHLDDIDLIHGSPPCQGYSIMNNLPWIRKRTYPLLILPLREILEDIGKPYVIENVAGAASKRHLEKLGLLEHRLRAGWLCGGMFGLPIYRHRYFETNWFWPMPGHPKHARATVERPHDGGPMDHGRPRYDAMRKSTKRANWDGKNPVNSGWRAGHDGQGVADGHAAGWKVAAAAMGISWMRRSELTQAIPPAYTEYIGTQLIALLSLDARLGGVLR